VLDNEAGGRQNSRPPSFLFGGGGRPTGIDIYVDPSSTYDVVTNI
jgi:hypothetical protein